MKGLTDRALEQVAEYFGALAVPARLKLLNALRDGERRVGELTALTGCSQANASKHLAVLTQNGFVVRSVRGTSAYYRIADPAIYRLCDTVCGQIGRRYAKQADFRRMFLPARRKANGRARSA
jgi:DNA-binding transcriptional ArsR family regulator